jgi:hypothetical protein
MRWIEGETSGQEVVKSRRGSWIACIVLATPGEVILAQAGPKRAKATTSSSILI